MVKMTRVERTDPNLLQSPPTGGHHPEVKKSFKPVEATNRYQPKPVNLGSLVGSPG